MLVAAVRAAVLRFPLVADHLFGLPLFPIAGLALELQPALVAAAAAGEQIDLAWRLSS